jgi:putative spermidine/putrescine transport system substrate-binding protein
LAVRALPRALATLLAYALLVGCAATPPSPEPGGDGPYDAQAAAEQARTFVTYGMPDEWANYGEQFTTFCQISFGFDCNRPERSQGEDLLGAEEIQRLDAERNNPVAILTDIGIVFVLQAERVGITADYLPPNADVLPAPYKSETGGWVATFAGVPSFIVNLDALAARELPVPRSWRELADPRYAGMVGLNRVGISGSGTWSFVAMNLAAGGTMDDYGPGVDYARRLLPNLVSQASLETFEKGEVPISVRFDYNHLAWLDALEERGVRAEIVIPADGSIYGPSALLMNRYETAHRDFGKMFMEWVLTDEGQAIFARFGARPIRSIVGDRRLEVPADARDRWLPDEMYANVVPVDFRGIDSEEIATLWEEQVVGGP